MKNWFALLLPLLVLLVFGVIALKRWKTRQSAGTAVQTEATEEAESEDSDDHYLDRLKPTPVLTLNEQAMFHRLKDALPGMIIMPQVAFSALMTHTDKHSRLVRNHFDRKRADFVVCNKGFAVIAVIELDDASHAGKEAYDQERDAMLKRCGYEVRRYKSIPDAEVVQADVLPILQSKAATLKIQKAARPPSA